MHDGALIGELCVIVMMVNDCLLILLEGTRGCEMEIEKHWFTLADGPLHILNFLGREHMGGRYGCMYTAHPMGAQ